MTLVGSPSTLFREYPHLTQGPVNQDSRVSGTVSSVTGSVDKLLNPEYLMQKYHIASATAKSLMTKSRDLVMLLLGNKDRTAQSINIDGSNLADKNVSQIFKIAQADGISANGKEAILNIGRESLHEGQRRTFVSNIQGLNALGFRAVKVEKTPVIDNLDILDTIRQSAMAGVQFFKVPVFIGTTIRDILSGKRGTQKFMEFKNSLVEFLRYTLVRIPKDSEEFAKAYRIIKTLETKDPAGIASLVENIKISETEKDLISVRSELPLYLKNGASYIGEGVFTSNGKVEFSENLVRFGDKDGTPTIDKYGNPILDKNGNPIQGVNIVQGLEELKENDLTIGLLYLGLTKILSGKIQSGIQQSINIYVKDLGRSDFQDIIQTLIAKYNISKEQKKMLIFEILEDRHGTINTTVIENIQWLQSQGFRLAIDDLHLKTASNLSTDLLYTLAENNIALDYLKIDGHLVQEILSGTIKDEDLKNLKVITISATQNKTKIVVEWIKNLDEIRKIQDILEVSKYKINMLFQGRDLKESMFLNNI